MSERWTMSGLFFTSLWTFWAGWDLAHKDMWWVLLDLMMVLFSMYIFGTSNEP